MAVLIYTENFDGKFKKSAFELLSYGKEIAKKLNLSTVAVTFGDVSEESLKELGEYGTNKVIKITNNELKDFSATAYSASLSQVAKAENAKIIIFGSNPSGRALAPALSVKTDAGLAAGVVSLPDSYDPFSVKKRAYSGKAFADIVLKTETKILTLTQNSYKIVKDQTDITIEEFSVEIPANAYNAKPLEVLKNTGKLSVTDADILVSGGRGLKGPENWGMLEEMADILGAATCCSRPITDLDWRPHHEHVGQTGKVVAPDLYIALGISGAVQHLAGVNGSKVMVAVNTDKDAPIFESADYGIIGDIFDVVPKLNEAFRKFKDS